MDIEAHTSILRKVGAVLLAIGLIDIAIMVYCIANKVSYSSSFNIFAVIAGIFLFRGSLRAASVVRWFAVFMLAVFSVFLLAWPLLQPMSLTLTQVRLNPGFAAAAALFMLSTLLLLYWVQQQLGQRPILEARAATGKKVRDMRIPVAVGIAFVILLNVALGLMLRGESGEKAVSIAKEKLGPTYQYHLSSLTIKNTQQGNFYSGVVTAWSDQKIESVSVEWKD
jgi:hypothetical protein